MNNKIFFGLLVMAAGVLVGWFVFKGEPLSYQDRMAGGSETRTTTPDDSSRSVADQPVVSVTGMPVADKGGVSTRTVVAYSDSGFGPMEVTITEGSTVTFVNESNRSMWVASAVHPTHSLLPGFDQLTSVARGGTYEYTFTKVGTWKYHNHMFPSDTATVIVTK